MLIENFLRLESHWVELLSSGFKRSIEEMEQKRVNKMNSPGEK